MYSSFDIQMELKYKNLLTMGSKNNFIEIVLFYWQVAKHTHAALFMEITGFTDIDETFKM